MVIVLLKMLQLEKHSVELVEKLNNVAKDNEEYREVDISTLRHEDITYITKFVRKHSQTLEEKGIGEYENKMTLC